MLLVYHTVFEEAKNNWHFFLKKYTCIWQVLQHFVLPFIFLFIFMIQFISWAFRELKHVVWPTSKETQKYFGIVIALLVTFWIYLFIFSNVFSEILFQLKNTFNPSGNVQVEGVKVNPEDIFIDEKEVGGVSEENQISTWEDITWEETIWWESLIPEISWEDAQVENTETQPEWDIIDETIGQ